MNINGRMGELGPNAATCGDTKPELHLKFIAGLDSLQMGGGQKLGTPVSKYCPKEKIL